MCILLCCKITSYLILMSLWQSDQTRAHCAATLLQFLLDYPLGPRRLEAHLVRADQERGENMWT